MAHPYTRHLMNSIPKANDMGFFLNAIPGMVPGATEYGEGCLFAERCSQVMDICRKNDGPQYNIEQNHFAFCHLYKDGNLTKNFTNQNRIKLPKKIIQEESILSIKSLRTWFPLRKGVFLRIANHVKAVDNINIEVQKGSTLALVGESGCGKTTLGESILRLTKEAKGEVLFNGLDIMKLNTTELKNIRKQIQIVFQDPMGSLSPRMTVEKIIGEGLEEHYKDINESELKKRIAYVLNEVGLPNSVLDRYPHEFSGGQRQRVGIARALALRPEFIVCDEAISALDVSIQAQVVNLLEDLQEEFDLTYLFIAHDLSMVKHISDRVAVMYLGKLVELTERQELYDNPLHPYTQALLSAVPIPDPIKEKQRNRVILTGDVPSPSHPPEGCNFNPRCPIAEDICRREDPEWRMAAPGHWVACHLVN
ncbi:MAG: ATP-binding cassette domain-containing protein [Chloroflexi bacterium]|nr:ATP-binding cassette domain-containing protein [Chloroflexota bacterium]